MNLHENPKQFNEAIRAASDHLGIRENFIEKDYWVTMFLKRLAESEFKEQVVFKGGTSLSKVFNLIARFSEDVDLAIIKSPGQTETNIRNLIRKVEKCITKGFSEGNIKGLTSKRTNYRKTAYDYNKVLDHYPGNNINEKLVLEINSFANPEPHELKDVESIIAKFFSETNQSDRISEFGLQPFELNVLLPESTLIEKILAVIRLSFFDNYLSKLREKVRHFYDIYFLSRTEFGASFINSDNFIKRLKILHEEDKKKFGDPENYMKSLYTDAPILNSFDSIWDQLKTTYNTDFKDLVHGEFPDEKKIADQFNKIINILKK